MAEILKRGSGILLHITSLPSKFGIGDLGPEAYKFADFLARAGQRYWQILPLNPTVLAFDNSPYHSVSAFAYNPLLLSPEILVKEGYLKRSALATLPAFPNGCIDFQSVVTYKQSLFDRAFKAFKERGEDEEYKRFCSEHAYWLDDFTLFSSLKAYQNGKVWDEWPTGLRDRKTRDLAKIKNQLQEQITRAKFLQYMFHRQWWALKAYCQDKGIHIIGDMPIYMTYDSVDIWTHPELFKLDENKKPIAVSGVPPDYFSRTGQLWGNPVYDWEVMKSRGYAWWLHRIRHNITLFDIVRIDHFRGLVAYWEVKAGAKTAINGKWVRVPAMDFFKKMMIKNSRLPVIAEDLGVITNDVRDVMHRFKIPGMRVLQFAFGSDFPNSDYLPHSIDHRSIMYTGTHDNNTTRGWYQNETTLAMKNRIANYLGHTTSSRRIHWDLIRLAMMSVANVVIVPMQDILGLGTRSRMNRPATGNGNWRWQLLPDQLTPEIRKKLLELTRTYGRVTKDGSVP